MNHNDKVETRHLIIMECFNIIGLKQESQSNLFKHVEKKC